MSLTAESGKGSFAKVPFSYLKTIPRNERYSKFEAAGSWYADRFANRPLAVSDYARIWRVKYDTARLWIAEFETHPDMKPKLLENQGVSTGKLLEKVSLLEQELTSLKSNPLENDWKTGGTGLEYTIRENRKEESNTKDNVTSLKSPKADKPTQTDLADPDTFAPSASDIAYGRKNGLDILEIEYQAERFIIYADERAAKKPRDAYKDLHKAYKNWLSGPYFKPMPVHVRSAREAEYAKKQDEIVYDIHPVQEVGPEMQIPKLPFEV